MKEEQWLVEQMRKCNVPEPSVTKPKPPRGKKKLTKSSRWTLHSRGKRFTTIKHEYITLRRDDIINKACERIIVVKADLVCFIDDRTWDECTAPLLAARTAVSRIRNQATQLMLANDRAPDLFGEGVKHDDRALNIYKRVGLLQEEIAEEAAKKVAKLEKEEAALLAKGRRIAKKHTKLGQVQTKLLRARAEANLDLSGSTQGAIAQAAKQTYKNWRGNRFKMDVPSMRPNQPVPLRAGSDHPEWNIAETNENYKVSFRVCSNFGWQHVVIKVKNKAHHATIRKYLEGKATRRDAKLFYDERRKKWIIAMAFGVSRAVPTKDKGSAAIRIGVRDFIFLMDDRGHIHDLETFHKATHEMKSHDTYRQRIIPRKLEFKQLKSDARKSRNFQGRGARGHGKKRFNRISRRGSDSESRFVKTWTGQVAQAAVRYCRRHGIGTVYVAQMSTVMPDHVLECMDDQVAWLIKRFPFCTLRDRIIQSLDKEGIGVVVTEDDRDCSACPSCGHVDKMNHNPRTSKFWCTACGMRLRADFAAAWNYLKKNGVDCRNVKRAANHIQKHRESIDEKRLNAAEENSKFEAAHNKPEAAE